MKINVFKEEVGEIASNDVHGKAQARQENMSTKQLLNTESRKVNICLKYFQLMIIIDV